jgi:hypothetical protein
LLCFHFPSSSSSPAQSETNERNESDGQSEALLRDKGPEAGIQLQTSNPRGRKVALATAAAAPFLPNIFHAAGHQKHSTVATKPN